MKQPPAESRPTVEDIDKAVDVLPLPEAVDYKSLYEREQERAIRVADQNFKLREERSQLKQELSSRKELDQLIVPYAAKAFGFMCVYCGFVALVLLADGLSAFGFSLPHGVLKLLVGSTAVTVIGLVGMVLTGVFVGAKRR